MISSHWKVGSDLPLPTPQLRHCSNPIISQLNKTGDDDCDDCGDDDFDGDHEVYCDDDCDEDDCDGDHYVDNHDTKRWEMRASVRLTREIFAQVVITLLYWLPFFLVSAGVLLLSYI